MALIKSLLDTDLYKLTMMQCALHQFPTVDVEYTFRDRNNRKYSYGEYRYICEEIRNFCNLQFTKSELEYLSSVRFFKKDFIEFLRLYKPNIDHTEVIIGVGVHGNLEIKVRGPWFLTIPFEVPILAIVSSTISNEVEVSDLDIWKNKNKTVTKFQKNGIYLSEFGTRRRSTLEFQEGMICDLATVNPEHFLGTSNMYIARKHNLRPIGTMAHEFLMIGQGLDDVPLVKFQQRMLQAWADEYRGDLGIALTDTIGIDAFLRDFDLYLAKLYDGLRHDSGDPYLWTDKVLDHYKKLGVDARTKSLIFSDSLTIDKAVAINQYVGKRAKVSFGIGTNLSNRRVFENRSVPNIVMKLTKVNGKPVAKISDSPGKEMCEDEDFVNYLKKVFLVKD